MALRGGHTHTQRLAGPFSHLFKGSPTVSLRLFNYKTHYTEDGRGLEWPSSDSLARWRAIHAW